MTKNLGFSIRFPEISLFSDDVNVKQDYEDFKRFYTEEKVNVEYEIWEFKLDSKQYLLSIRDKEVSLHLEYALNKMEGESSTREKALKYFIKKYASSFVRYSGKIAVCSYSSFRRGASKESPLKKRYYSVTDLFKKAKLEITEPNESKKISIIAKLEPIKRSREFNSYNESARDTIVYEYLFHSRTHRWLDENIIELNPDESRGYQAMGILHFIGLKDKHKGIFKGLSIQEAITMLKQQDSDFSLVIQSLHRYGKQENTNLDVEAESAAGDYTELESIVAVTPEQIKVTETEKEQVIKSRIGQSTFKKALLEIEKKCGLCGVIDKRLLVASHIKPWSQSNHQERLDVNNGLLLCPNHDALFDKGYISFDDDGTILISESLDEATKVFLNINETMKVTLNEQQQKYMNWHWENIFYI
ncbi:HNH endonuclease [Bacillus thuringiensis]|uniref:HNH endonuclease n=1 Tax=Bacillus thuringiensis TaxID=1428 RepID=UPI0020CF1B61|nr:HNH endonuclease signature motif containing protein [Bacillus thuringiensis]